MLIRQNRVRDRRNSILAFFIVSVSLGVTAPKIQAQTRPPAGAPSGTNAESGTNLWKKVAYEKGGSYPHPTYPATAMKQRLQGVVAVNIVVATNGLPTEVAVKKSSGQAVLDENTVDWIKNKWRWPSGQTRHYYWDCHYRLESGSAN